jgi:hypothetical protein
MRRMVNKLRKMPSGTPLPPGGGAPSALPKPELRVKPLRTRSLTDALGGLKLRAAATQVHESISNLRRSGSTRLKSALKRRHSAPAELGHPAPDAPRVPESAELPGSPVVVKEAPFNPDALHEPPGPQVKRFVLDGEHFIQHGNGLPKRVPDLPPQRPASPIRTPPPLDAASMLRADLNATHLAHIAKRPFDAPWLAQQRELAVRRNDAQALQAQREFLNHLHLDAIYRARDLSARFAGLPLAAETLELIEQAKLDIAQQVTREKLAVMAAEKQLRLKPPQVPPRPNVHELP